MGKLTAPNIIVTSGAYPDIGKGTFTASLGDVFVFGKTDETDLRQLHLAVEIDKDLQTRQPLLIHATSIDRAVTVWPLSRFSSYAQYQKLFAIKRLKRP